MIASGSYYGHGLYMGFRGGRAQIGERFMHSSHGKWSRHTVMVYSRCHGQCLKQQRERGETKKKREKREKKKKEREGGECEERGERKNKRESGERMERKKRQKKKEREKK